MITSPFIAKAPLVMVFLADVQRWFDYYLVSRGERILPSDRPGVQGA